MTLLSSLALVALLALPARAASRMVLTLPPTVSVVLDNAPVTAGSGMGRLTVSSLAAGRHNLQLRDPQGMVVYQATIEVPDNASISASWDGSTMTLVGAHEVSAMSAEGDAPFKAEGDEPVAPDTAALERANDTSDQSQLASRNGQAAESDHHAVGGRVPSQVSQALGGAATTAIGIPQIAADPIVSTVGSGFAYMVNTAAAGGIRKRYSPDSRQGRPDLAPPVMEQVKLINDGGQPMSVFIDGMWLDDFAAGETQKVVKIEVGRRELAFVDPALRQIVFQGSLRVKKDYVIELHFSPTQAPKATNATWAWAPL